MSESPSPGVLFNGRIPSGETVYVEVPIRNGCLGAFIAWKDAVSSATITLELTSIIGAAHSAPASWYWKDSGVSITGPGATALGSSLVNVENVRQRRARLKIVAAAACEFFITDGTAE